MRRIELDGGHWAVLREPARAEETGDLRDYYTVSGRRGISVLGGRVSLEGRQLIESINVMEPGPERDLRLARLDMDLSEEDLDTFLRLTEATVVALLSEWSLARPLPTVKTVGDLPGPIYDQLSAAAAEDAAKAADLSLDTSVGDGTPDPKEPSGGSESSSGA